MKTRELKRLFESLGPDQTCDYLGQAIDEKKISLKDVSIRDLFEGLHDDGAELLRMIDPRRKSGRTELFEAAGAVDSSTFSTITRQFAYSKIKEAFNDATNLADQLAETIPTTFLDGEIIPGIGRIGDEAQVVTEGDPYPRAGTNEEYYQTPRTTKRGLIVEVTREIIVADRTGLLLRRCGEVGHWLGVNKEKRVMDVATGQTNNYKRNGTATNTYLAAGAYINVQASNALVDWTDIENIELLADAITDPNTGDFIDITAAALLVPTALKRTAMRIVNATEVRHGDGASAGYQTIGANPLTGSSIQVLSSPRVKDSTSSATTWFYGDWKRGVAYMEVWGIETEQAGQNSEAAFNRDVWVQYKASERGAAWAQEPRYLFKSTA